MTRKTLIGLILLLSVVGLVAVLLRNAPERGDLIAAANRPARVDFTMADGGANPPAPRPGLERAARPAPRPAAPDDDEAFADRMVQMLRLLYGEAIDRTSVQARLIAFRDQIYRRFGDDGEARFLEILKAAFPGRWQEILRTMDDVESFDDWLVENSAELDALAPPEQQEAVLEKRREIFGEERAADLARAELEREHRDRSMKKTMKDLESAADATLDDKLATYMDALESNYAGGPDAWTLGNPSLLAHAFFGLESVSDALAALGPAERQAKINEIRAELGYTEEQIAAQEARDQRREERWQNGLAYMAERQALEERASGADFERELTALQERYFAHEAQTIAAEEADGFYRFERPRLYGRN